MGFSIIEYLDVKTQNLGLQKSHGINRLMRAKFVSRCKGIAPVSPEASYSEVPTTKKI